MKDNRRNRVIVVASAAAALLTFAGLGWGMGGAVSPPTWGTTTTGPKCNTTYPMYVCDHATSVCDNDFPDDCTQFCTSVDPVTGGFYFWCQSMTSSGW